MVKGQEGRAGEEEEEEEQVVGGDEQAAAAGDSGEKDEGREGEKKSEGEKSTPAQSSQSQWSPVKTPRYVYVASSIPEFPLGGEN